MLPKTKDFAILPVVISGNQIFNIKYSNVTLLHLQIKKRKNFLYHTDLFIYLFIFLHFLNRKSDMLLVLSFPDSESHTVFSYY